MSPVELANLRYRLKEAGIKQADIADALDITANKISLSLAGKREFKVAEIDYIRQLLDAHERVPGHGMKVRSVPNLGTVPAGNWRAEVRHARGYVDIADDGSAPNLYAVDIEGDSMDLVAPDGGKAILNPDDVELWPGRYYVVRNPEGEVTFKKFMTDPARLEPCSSNPAHKTILIGREGFEVVARVKSVQKTL